MDATTTTWAAQLVLAAIVGLVGFLARNAFGKVETALDSVIHKLDDVVVRIERGDGDRRVLAQQVVALEHRLAALEHELRELRETFSEGARR